MPRLATGRLLPRALVLVLVVIATSVALWSSPLTPAGATERRTCGSIQYTPQSDDSVSRIATVGLTCRKARRALRRYAYLGEGGWRCRKVPGSGSGLSGSGRFHCRKHGKLIAYTYP